LVFVVKVKAESDARSVTWASATGKCWQSWTTPWIEEKTVASADTDANRRKAEAKARERMQNSTHRESNRWTGSPARMALRHSDAMPVTSKARREGLEEM
jgi:hypothetical protein